MSRLCFIVAPIALVMAAPVSHAQPGDPPFRRARFVVLRPQEVPRINGSTAAAPLTQMLMLHALGWPARRQFDGQQVEVRPDDLEAIEQWRLEILPRIEHEGSDAAYQSLIRGDSDLIVVDSQPADDHVQLAQEAAVELAVRQIAWDATVTVIQRDDPNVPPRAMRYSVYVVAGDPNLTLLSYDDVTPTPQTIAEGTYKLREPVYVVTRRDPPRHARELRDWMVSYRAYHAVTAAGCVPYREQP